MTVYQHVANQIRRAQHVGGDGRLPPDTAIRIQPFFDTLFFCPIFLHNSCAGDGDAVGEEDVLFTNRITVASTRVARNVNDDETGHACDWRDIYVEEGGLNINDAGVVQALSAT